MPLDPDAPHAHRPLDITARKPKAMRHWLRFNLGLRPEDVPCTVCGGSWRSPVHFDSGWKPPAPPQAVPCPGAASRAGCSPERPHPPPGPLGLHWVADPVHRRTGS